MATGQIAKLDAKGVLPCSVRVVVVVIGVLLHGETFRLMEKKLSTSGPLRESADKHSIYTVQLLWHLCLAEPFPDIQLEIMATDIDPHMLERARQGRYSQGSLKDLPLHWLEVGFERCGDDYVVRDTFRERIGFAAQDIRCELPAGPFHLVMCRNLVFTYFADPVQRVSLTRIATRLAPGGILLVGKHETLPSARPDWVPCADRQGFFRKVDAAMAAPEAMT